MISDDVQRIELDARRRSLDEYKLRCQDLRGENDALKSEKDQRETDALQIISFLRRDAERKDELIESLKNTINQQRDLFAQQREEERQQATDRLQEKEAEWSARETQMRSQIEALTDELHGLQEFKEQKSNLEEKLEQQNQDKLDMEADHKELMAAMERKFFEEKGRLAKEYKQMLAEMKKTSQEEAVERLDASTKKILFENRRMAEELRVQVQETDELQKAKAFLEDENKKLRREVQLHEQSVKEYAKKGFRQTKEIKELGSKVKTLERSLSTSIRDFGNEKEELALRDRKRIAEMELDSAGLRQLVKLKSKELANVKKLASIILHKRNEVETFLLEAIEQVKEEIGKQRADEERGSARFGRSSSKLPQLGPARPSNLPTSADERVDIRDLTWEDRERVLRLLFAKINNSATQKPMPHHALTQPGPAAGMPRGMVDATLLQYPPTGESGSVGGYSQSQASPDLPFPHDDMAMFMTQPGVA
eukprot:Transcript_25065.p1 GENE.Transcript_25065~~Transcript_25065.p1  ORF type:complete len:481 (+),score=298.65 Transcript_25065:97-1539(+)